MTPNADKHWTKEEEEKLNELNNGGIGLKKLALAMGRTEDSVKTRLRDLKRWRASAEKSKVSGSISSPAKGIIIHKAKQGRY